MKLIKKVALAENRTSKSRKHHTTSYLPSKCFKYENSSSYDHVYYLLSGFLVFVSWCHFDSHIKHHCGARLAIMVEKLSSWMV